MPSKAVNVSGLTQLEPAQAMIDLISSVSRDPMRKMSSAIGGAHSSLLDSATV